MQSHSAVATGAAAVSGAMLGGMISWICTVCNIAAPPPDVAGTMGAIVLTAGHVVANWFINRAATPAMGATK